MKWSDLIWQLQVGRKVRDKLTNKFSDGKMLLSWVIPGFGARGYGLAPVLPPSL